MSKVCSRLNVKKSNFFSAKIGFFAVCIGMALSTSVSVYAQNIESASISELFTIANRYLAQEDYRGLYRYCGRWFAYGRVT